MFRQYVDTMYEKMVFARCCKYSNEVYTGISAIYPDGFCGCMVILKVRLSLQVTMMCVGSSSIIFDGLIIVLT